MTDNPPSNRLDGVLVVGTLLIVAGVLYGLFTQVDDITKALPIISGLASGLVGAVIGGYAGYRWGASAAMKRQDDAPGSPS